MPSKPVHIAQISDLHIKSPDTLAYGRVDTANALERCVTALNEFAPKPDLVVISGDLADTPTGEEYEHLKRLLAPLKVPFVSIPGNHDSRELMRAAFPQAYASASGPLNQRVEIGGVDLVLLDSSVHGKPHGELEMATLQWLDATLAAAPRKPTIVALHHPPFWTGIGHMDRMGLANPDALEAVIARHSQVERVVSGHLHRAIITRFGGTIASTCPSPSHQVALDLADDAQSRFVMEPPGFQLHLWREGASLITHTGAIGDFAGPYSFYEGGVLID